MRLCGSGMSNLTTGLRYLLTDSSLTLSAMISLWRYRRETLEL